MPVFTHSDSIHPKFSLPMELLLCLPSYPHRVPLSTIVSDLRLQTQIQAHNLIEQLRELGFEIFVTNSTNYGRVACVSTRSWMEARASGEKYWDEIYGPHVMGL